MRWLSVSDIHSRIPAAVLSPMPGDVVGRERKGETRVRCLKMGREGQGRQDGREMPEGMVGRGNKDETMVRCQVYSVTRASGAKAAIHTKGSFCKQPVMLPMPEVVIKHAEGRMQRLQHTKLHT